MELSNCIEYEILEFISFGWKDYLVLCFRFFFYCLCFLYCREKFFFKLYDFVVLFEIEFVYFFYDRKSILIVIYVFKEIIKYKIVILCIERYINVGIIVRLIGC